MWLHSLTPKQREALLGLAHNVVVSDGLLDPNEELMMDEFRREMELTPEIEAQYRELDGIEGVFDTKRSRAVALINLLHLSYVDGAFEIEEECFLRELSQLFSVTDNEFLLMDNWVRRLVALEKEASAFM
jgi:tellurite resistance protein